MIHEIRPYDGIGPLHLGMAREQVRTIMAEMPREVPRSIGAVSMDAFHKAGFQIEYDGNGLCVSITATHEASPTFHGRRLVGQPFREMRKWFEQLDPSLEMDGAGMTSRALGVGLYAPYAIKEPDEPVEAAIVFVRGYYESE